MYTLRIQSTGRSPPFRPTKGYTDSDYVGSLDNRKLTSGYVFNYGGDAISWRSKLQDFTALWTTEAEYIATSEAADEAIWLHWLSADISAKGRIERPAPTLYCNSQSAIHLIKNPVNHPKTKHIEVRYHHIRDLVTDKKLEVRKVDTKVNIADRLTKPLLDQRFNRLKGHIGLQQASEQRRTERKVEAKSTNDTTRQVEQTKLTEPCTNSRQLTCERSNWALSDSNISRLSKHPNKPTLSLPNHALTNYLGTFIIV